MIKIKYEDEHCFSLIFSFIVIFLPFLSIRNNWWTVIFVYRIMNSQKWTLLNLNHTLCMC